MLIHTNTSDKDVNVLEVEHLIQVLKAEGKKFDYEIYKDIPGGRYFDQVDSKKAKEIRIKICDYLSKYLHPDVIIKDTEELNRISYYRSK